ncbi:MAG: type II secretion system F family protein [Eubacterium sp.]|nr:type II secretion system F family protein [Eubacterium sp.]
MIYIYVVILGIYVLLCMVSRKEESGNPFRRMALYLLRKKQNLRHKASAGRRRWKNDLQQKQLADKLKTLQPSTAASVQIKEYYVSQYSVILMVVFAGVLVCLAAWISVHSSSLLKEGNYITRNSYGEGDITIELAAQIEGEEEELFQYIVGERKFTEEEAEALYQQAIAELPEVICGQNEKLEDVRYDLELVTRMEGYPFELSWESGNYSLVNTDGAVDNAELQENEVVMLTAHFKYEQWTWDHQLYVQINSPVYTHREIVRNKIEELLHMQEERTKNTQTMILPESVESEPIVWREVIEDSSGYLLLLVLLAAGVLYWGKGREIDRQLEQRKKELLLDYPEIVNKLSLYMGAGMTIRNAFVKMGEDYKKQQKERRRYVYEEILITCNELQSGRSEKEAYDHFGKRCQVQAYMKLSTLLSQNIRKGSNDLLYMLRQEADNAFAERKNMAKKLGEEAGTKLLLPMMMMLCIVMVIIMIPAYFSFVM